MTTYSIRMPDMSRNMALAGQTVSTRGMNVTYDEKGYAVKASNYRHELFANTSRSIRAASKEAVLAGDSRAGYDGPDEDRRHFSDHEFARAVELRRQVAAGELSEREANARLEEIRRMYGYSFGVSGNHYAAVTFSGERQEEAVKAEAASVTAQAASVQSDAPPQDAPGGVEQFRESYQARLLEQQQRQTIHSELEELRLESMLRVDAKEKTSDVLLALMDEDEDE